MSVVVYTISRFEQTSQSLRIILSILLRMAFSTNTQADEEFILRMSAREVTRQRIIGTLVSPHLPQVPQDELDSFFRIPIAPNPRVQSTGDLNNLFAIVTPLYQRVSSSTQRSQ